MIPATTVLMVPFAGRMVGAEDFADHGDEPGLRVIVSDVDGPNGPLVRLTFNGRSVDIVGWHGRRFDGPSALMAGAYYRERPRFAFIAWAENGGR